MRKGISLIKDLKFCELEIAIIEGIKNMFPSSYDERGEITTYVDVRCDLTNIHFDSTKETCELTMTVSAEEAKRSKTVQDLLDKEKGTT